MNQHVQNTVQFVQTKLLLHKVSVRVVPYKLCPLYALLSTCLTCIQISTIAVLAGGLYVLTHLCNIHSGSLHQLLVRYEQNKWVLIMGTFIVGNLLQNTLSASTAFEVYRGVQLVWSGLETGRPASTDELVAAFARVGVQSLLTTHGSNF
eukprot:GHVS01036359.1.p1 GENE.GHVS01036359.1~~GHVS01036359.1.p1  ORF type:complete len:150 (-),score=20.69 GHVS01036359.1:186-635(-)